MSPLFHHDLWLGPAPTTLVFADSLERAAQRGTILFYHGLHASRQGQLKELRSLAAHGFLAIGIDNMGHGERRTLEFEAKIRSEATWESAFLEALLTTVDEVPSLVDLLLAKGWAHPQHIGVAGISMGGHIAYSAVLADRRISVATPILGSPSINSPRSPDRHLERFFPVALLSQNAAQDTNVPPWRARVFHERLAATYSAAPEREAYIEYPESGHFMLEYEWNQLWETTVRWFERFL